MESKLIKLFLRYAIAIGFLSAVTDRLGYWPKEVSAWGNWDSFLGYTEVINPWIPGSMIPFAGTIASIAEVVFALCLIIGFKTTFFAKLSGYLMLLFAIAITLSSGVKGALDYSVFAASAGAFALSVMKDKYFEIDLILGKKE